jgi:hypothetical protein
MPIKYQRKVDVWAAAAMMGSVVVFLVVVMRQLAMPPTSSSSTITTMTTTTNGDVSKAGNGYINLSCPYEMSKFSCAYMITHDEKDGSCSDGSRAQETLDASTEYYLQNMDMIQSIFRLAEARGKEQGPRRIFFTGDSLMRQIFIAIACNAMSSLPQGVDLIEHAVFPWKDAWPTNSIGPCLKTGGQHSGFDAASIRLTNKLEIHWVPHTGYMDSNTAEHEVLERLRQDIIDHNGRITFGTKTAVPLPPDTHVDVLVYNNGMISVKMFIHSVLIVAVVACIRFHLRPSPLTYHSLLTSFLPLPLTLSLGIHHQLEETREKINYFINWISKPLMTGDYEGRRTRTIYVTTPTQHYNTQNGQWQPEGMAKENKVCNDRVDANPRAELEKELLLPGENVNVLLDYDDFNLGVMHVQRGNDCSHYCMPGVPDVVAARLMKELLG